jgi:hypothetical protein
MRLESMDAFRLLAFLTAFLWFAIVNICHNKDRKHNDE